MLILTFLRVKAICAILMDKFLTGPDDINIPHVQDALVHVGLASGEVILLDLTIWSLERTVSFFFFCLKHLLTLCHTVSLSEGHLHIGSSRGPQ